ncbi:hypothetical protein Dsin_023508 [Dipteronia sinensis]|uniref:Activator of Hsp90 ATPase homologue 1/2-like C-terminal domain-containing protein n=1 Tax=Dipteronia sinensis TaxID=43782 RepID=A0AAE0E0U8_9ROSI|nr:hypothetical protein Dsin_023508 [Dipteronia sinensis]
MNSAFRFLGKGKPRTTAKWRFGSWPDGIDSTVRLTFDEPEPGVTVVKLIHTDIPEEDRNGNATVVENTERGWRDLILHKIRAVWNMIFCFSKTVYTCRVYCPLMALFDSIFSDNSL